MAKKFIPNMDKSEMFICQYNPSDGASPSYFTVAKEKLRMVKVLDCEP